MQRNIDGMRKWTKPLIVLVLLTTLIISARVLGLDQKLNDLKEWMAGQGIWGPIVFAGVYALATVIVIPGSAMTIAAGALFGSVIGVITVLSGATIGAALCFLIARYFARNAIAATLSKNEKFQKLDTLTEKHGAIIVAITRLVPLFPFNLLNYGFGLTKVPFITYVFWSALCMLPGTILFVVGTDAVATTLRDGSIPWVLVAVVALIVVILTAVVRQALKVLKD